MKIALTALGSEPSSALDPRFGRAALFLVYDTETKAFASVANPALDAGQGAGLKAAEAVVKVGATAVVTGDCGPKALRALSQANVRTYAASLPSVAEALAAFLDGRLSEIAPS
jgi:predicted Fe-Mo cluster-binding NifX family protein